MGQIHTWQKMREAEDEGRGKSYTTSTAFTAGLSEHLKAPSSKADHEEKTTVDYEEAQWGSDGCLEKESPLSNKEGRRRMTSEEQIMPLF